MIEDLINALSPESSTRIDFQHVKQRYDFGQPADWIFIYHKFAMVVNFVCIVGKCFE